jgi:hypothetical protein
VDASATVLLVPVPAERAVMVPPRKPCSRCNGSGTEPDAIAEAVAELADMIRDIPVGVGAKDKLAAGVARLRDVAREREALLDEILGRFSDAPDDDGRRGIAATHWVVQVPVADIQSWRERRS